MRLPEENKKVSSLEKSWLTLPLTTLDSIKTYLLLAYCLCSLLLFSKMSRGIFKRDNGFSTWNPPESRW